MVICIKCSKQRPLNHFHKFNNGNIKQTCKTCSIKKKKDKTTEDKQYLNIIKLNRELRKKFRPQRQREHTVNWRANNPDYVLPSSRACPIWGFQRRSCSHCKRPTEYPIECKTIENMKTLMNELVK